jgi:hypothetical protein
MCKKIFTRKNINDFAALVSKGIIVAKFFGVNHKEI